MNTYADGRLTSAEATSVASEIIRGKWNQFATQSRPARSQTYAYHLHRLSLSFRNTKGQSEFCRAAESLFSAVIVHTDILEHIEHRQWNAVGFLLQLCRFRNQWRQSPDSWEGGDIETLPAGSNQNPLGRLDFVAFQKMRSLIRHLLGRYSMPGFWDSVWFHKLPPDCRYLDWYVHLSTGGSPLKIPDLPVSLTRKAAHWMIDAPPHYSVLQAMRRGQLKAEGIGDATIEAIIESRMAEDFANDDLWLPLIRSFDKTQEFNDCDLLIKYLHRRRTRDRHGEIYRVKGKTLASLTREMNSFYAAHPEYAEPDEVSPVHKRRKRRRVHNIGTHRSYRCWEEFDQETETTYSIIEIRKSYQLVTEGRRMRHCVGSYLGKCLNGQASIWSLRSHKGEKWKTHVTIEVNPRTNSIVQARKSNNFSPTAEDWIRIRKWAALNSLKIFGK